MSELTKEAIMHIEGMSKAGHVVDKADFLSILIPEGMKTKSLESMQIFKNRFSGFFETSSVNDFAEYTNKQPKKSCFVDPDIPKAFAIFDVGTLSNPLHCVHRAKVELKKTAIYRKLQNTLMDRHGQQGLAEFIEDNRDYLTIIDAKGEAMTAPAAADSVRNVTIKAKSQDDHVVKDMGQSRSMMDSIEASNGDKPLPGWITFKCKPYLDLKEYEFPIRVSMSVNREEILFKLTVNTMDLIIEEIQAEFKELIV